MPQWAEAGWPGQIGQVTPPVAGALGSYALFGVLVGALLAGSVADIVGRRKVMLTAYAWFSIGMGATALMNSVGGFGLLRFLTGIGVGALVATTGALVAAVPIFILMLVFGRKIVGSIQSSGVK